MSNNVLFKSNNSFKKKIALVIIAFSLIVLNIGQKVSAAPTGLLFNMPNGGMFEHTKMDYEYINSLNLSSIEIAMLNNVVVDKVEFIPPDIVKKQYDALALDVGISMSKEYIKTGISLAISLGITKAKEELTKKYGAAIASKIIPYLNALSWSWTAYNLLSTIETGQELSRLASAAQANKGLIYEWKGLVGSTFNWYYWDGSSQYGSYPTAILNPTPYQYGDVTIY